MVRRLNTHKFIPREREPLRVLTVAAIILPLGHALMAQPWEHESPGALLASCRLGLGTTEEVFSMCDYSLHNVKSRPAKVGDKLTTRNFNTGTRGFAAPEVASTAVCVLPGTELAFAKEVRCGPNGLFGRTVNAVINHTTAIFRQINKNEPRAHHDALEFPDGQIVRLTDVVEGQEATVLQLPAQPATATEAKAQERVAHVG
jgi:hypothetical protein